MPGCDCQHCAKDNDGVRRTANRISMAQLVAFHLDQSATKGANPLPDMCNVCVLKYQIKLSQTGYLKEFPSWLLLFVGKSMATAVSHMSTNQLPIAIV